AGRRSHVAVAFVWNRKETPLDRPLSRSPGDSSRPTRPRSYCSVSVVVAVVVAAALLLLALEPIAIAIAVRRGRIAIAAWTSRSAAEAAARWAAEAARRSALTRRISAAATAASSWTRPAAWWTGGSTLARLVDRQRATAKRLAVQRRNAGLRRRGIVDLHEGEAA